MNTSIALITRALLAIIGAGFFFQNCAAASALTVDAGQPVTIAVTADGTQPFTYQWRKNGTAISGATRATYVITAASTADSATYSAVVTNSVNSTVSDSAVLTVNAASVTAPTITNQPKSVTVTAGQSASFSVTATGALTYQWLKNSTAISGATSATYSIPATTTSNAGNYSVVVTNSGVSTTSSVATLTVNAVANTAPTITVHPVSVTVTAGQSASFSVTASGSATLTYQWLRNGGSITGATTATYVIPATTTANAARYSVVVSNSAGSLRSDGASLTVNPVVIPPAITNQPVSLTVIAGQPASFSVTASGSATLTYQWQKNGTAISGATSSTYAIPATTAANAGSYSVVVTNAASSIKSSDAVLTVNVAPTITAHPVAVTVTAGQPASFSVTASGSATLTYQWTKNSVAISGATRATYTIPVTTAADTARYFVVVSNSVGSIRSQSAPLTVNPAIIPPAITNQPVSLTVTAGQPASFSVTASGSATLTYQWRKNGTVISGATSATYSIPATAAADAASYSVVVTNSAGSVATNDAILSVEPLLLDLTPQSFSARGQSSAAPIANLFDGQASTKWADSRATSWVKVVFASPTVLEAYSFTSASDSPACDPASWILSGSNDGTTWTVIETRTAQSWGSRSLARDFILAAPTGAYTQFRFDLNASSGSVTQLAELELYGNSVVSVELTPLSSTAQGEASSKEKVALLFDNKTYTKWADLSGSTWVEIVLASPATLRRYTLAAAIDYPERDPASWTLSGSNDGINWTVIETRTAQTWSSRRQTREFVLTTLAEPFARYRFDFRVASGTITQLSELKLYGTP
ncbi:MAG: immunoglobulin domain-containing protein [Verrucomicrobia bacterium]|nr:immunoglobulin domain-containing protein [Verrucomicrobiota bacterium]